MNTGIKSRLTKTRVAIDYRRQLSPLNIMYNVDGLEGVVRHLKHHPLLTYEQMQARLLQLSRAYSASDDYIKEEYAVTEQNAETVRRIDAHVHLFNRAAREGRLTDRTYRRFYRHLQKLVGV
ncbi:MAG: hypothetical protein HYT72_03990 [Candidatus Aenigmarchaeota archaeon]|nr:hypothetical protein [Candidatus Aenigmarchaeota archaeon]